MRNHLSKKNWKLILLGLGMLTLALVVTGCASTNGSSVAPISHTSGNWWDRYIVYYISQFILWIASLVRDSYGWAIIIFTIIVRIILLPLNAISIKSMAKQQKVQPQMDALRKKYPGKDVESRQKLQEETSKLYKEAGINPYTGCLPMLIQLPEEVVICFHFIVSSNLADSTVAKWSVFVDGFGASRSILHHACFGSCIYFYKYVY